MKHTDSIPNADAINYVNIGLIALSCLIAIFLPFELFLFSYAVLGPAHYLTEISWLHQRGYFTRGKRDYWGLGLGALVLAIVAFWWPDPPPGEVSQDHAVAWIVALCFGAALVMVLVQHKWIRMGALLVMLGVTFFSKPLITLLAVFVPTLVHVYVFTGLFMLYGALKGRSRSGYLAVACFVVFPIVFLWPAPPEGVPGEYVLETYRMFAGLNVEMLGLYRPEMVASDDVLLHSIFLSKPGIVVMRLIAFAYTYHYLNWFSKTAVIQWHRISKRRMAVIAVLWAAAVGCYLWNFNIGFKVLFALSYLHVFLEFPLNHVTILGIGRELQKRRLTAGTPGSAVVTAPGAGGR